MKEVDVRQFSSDKILKHLDRVNEWLEGGNPSPITVELDVTNRCNHKCPECVVNYFRVADSSFLPLPLAKSIVEQLADKAKGVIFTGGGEPLCYPNILEIVKLAKNKGLDLGFITNGSLLNDESAEIILENCTWMRVSLDAGSPEIFKLTHGMGSGEFNKVVDNVALLVRTKKKLNSKCTVGVGFLTSEKSVSDMVKSAGLIKQLGVDYLQFRPLQIHQGGKFDYHWIDVHDRVEECLKYSGNGFEVLFSQHKYEMAHDSQYGRYYGKCYGHQFATVIAASGKMYICCHLRGYEKYCLGDLRVDSFEEIWNSEQRRKVIESIDFSDCIPLCRDNTFNQILWNIKQPREHVNFL